MNASLLNPFTITHPTAVQTSLVSGASFARFDPSGKYVAAGRSDGSAAIWDLDTRAAIRWLEGHVKSVTSVDWSRNSRYVMTSSKDWNIIIWDLASPTDPPQRHATIRFDAPVVSASFHPRNSRIILALLGTGEAYIVDLRKDYRGRVELCEVPEEGDDDAQASRSRSLMTTARFDPSGKHVFIGTSSGSVLVFNTRTKTMVARHKISGTGVMKGFDFAKNGRRLVTNSSDRTIRQFNLPVYLPPNAEREYIEQELEPTHRFNDPINKTAWHAMSFSPDGEWLAGGAADPATHKIYIWDISNDGQFASALDGGREPLIDVHWHPLKSSIVSTTNQGNILIWHCPTPERWGAFAGGFEEVDENVVYEEREDEFDIVSGAWCLYESELALRKKRQEDEKVDIIGGILEDRDLGQAVHAHNGHNGLIGNCESDEDLEWADEEPDNDKKGWRMKIIMVDGDDGF
ncbi:WD40 repeat-like protein [Leucogyrophana mollusca]|uniref:WD40 repeat-like protein n=1 Tax=Leucogyrophana mollusca TaxID=85980 RepID=A0ACB8C1C0_9AGAM|nr:WD40 repeat-like protein [Leucogyrophana mollusca]